MKEGFFVVAAIATGVVIFAPIDDWNHKLFIKLMSLTWKVQRLFCRRHGRR
jgi:hypothetical protein